PGAPAHREGAGLQPSRGSRGGGARRHQAPGAPRRPAGDHLAGAAANALRPRGLQLRVGASAGRAAAGPGEGAGPGQVVQERRAGDAAAPAAGVLRQGAPRVRAGDRARAVRLRDPDPVRELPEARPLSSGVCRSNEGRVTPSTRAAETTSARPSSPIRRRARSRTSPSRTPHGPGPSGRPSRSPPSAARSRTGTWVLNVSDNAFIDTGKVRVVSLAVTASTCA